jgi:hypothetical protein
MKISNFKILNNLNGPVLITGHTGFKGTWMTLLLQNIGFNVIGYSLNPEKDSLFNLAKRKGKIEETFEDIRDRKKLEKFIKKHKPSLIYHFAAQPLVINSYSNPYETFEINSIGTANILDIALRIDSVKFIGVVTTDLTPATAASGYIEDVIFDPAFIYDTKGDIIRATVWDRYSSKFRFDRGGETFYPVKAHDLGEIADVIRRANYESMNSHVNAATALRLAEPVPPAPVAPVNFGRFASPAGPQVNVKGEYGPARSRRNKRKSRKSRKN